MLELLSKVILSTWFVALCINELQLTSFVKDTHVFISSLISIKPTLVIPLIQDIHP